MPAHWQLDCERHRDPWRWWGLQRLFFFFRRQIFRPTPDQCQSQALRVLIGHRNFRLCQGLCRVIADPTMYPTIKTQSHSSNFNNTFPFSISFFPFWIPFSIYYPTIKISIPLFQVIPLPLFLYIPPCSWVRFCRNLRGCVSVSWNAVTHTSTLVLIPFNTHNTRIIV